MILVNQFTEFGITTSACSLPGLLLPQRRLWRGALRRLKLTLGPEIGLISKEVSVAENDTDPALPPPTGDEEMCTDRYQGQFGTRRSVPSDSL